MWHAWILAPGSLDARPALTAHAGLVCLLRTNAVANRRHIEARLMIGEKYIASRIRSRQTLRSSSLALLGGRSLHVDALVRAPDADLGAARLAHPLNADTGVLPLAVVYG